MIAVSDLTISLGHPEPFAVLTKVRKRLLRKIAADRKLTELPVYPGQGYIDRARKMSEIIFLCRS